MKYALVLLAAISCAGCFVQAGARAGAVLGDGDGNATWGGQLGAGYEDGLLLAAELDGRAVHGYGSAFGSGLQLGYAFGSELDRVRFALHGDTGLAFGFHEQASYYVGGTLELPLRLSAPSPLAERNRNFRFVGSAPWLVPFARYRLYHVGADGSRPRDLDHHEISAGVLMRMSYATDLL
jgi:hypothetical protein